MRAVWSRELKAFANSRISWILGGILLLINGVLMTLYHFYVGNARYETILGTMILAIACMLPLWTVSRFCAPYREKDERFLGLLPLSRGQIILGKILGALTVLGGAVLILGIFPLVLSMFGGKNLLSAYVSLGAVLLLGCAILFGLIVIALICRKVWLAYVVSYGLVAVLFVLARVAMLLPQPFSTVGSYLSLFGAFQPYAYMIFDWRTLLWYVAVALLLFAVVCCLALKTGRNLLPKQSVVAGILAILLVGATVGTAFLPAKATEMDMSASNMMSVSKDTKDFLATLDEDVTLYLLDDEEANEAGNGYEDVRYEYFLKKYASYSNRLKVERLPIAESGSLLAEMGITTDQVYQYCMVVKSEKRMQIVEYMSLLVYVHNNASLYSFGLPYEFAYSQYASYASAMESLMMQDATAYGDYYYAFYNDVSLHFKGERYLNAAIEYVASDLIPQKYVLTGNGESNLFGVALGDLMSGCQALTLSDGEEIPADASSVTVFVPTVDYTPALLQALTDYLNRGGTVNLITGESNLSMPNLMGWLRGFGLSAQPGAVNETVTKTVVNADQTETTETVRTDSVGARVNLDHDVLAAMESLGTDALTPSIKNGNAISFHATEDSSLLTTPILSTGENAFIGENTEAKGSYVLAAAAENNKGARLVWFTGADTFLASTSEVNGDITKAYAMACPYLASEWSDMTYRSALNPVPSVLYEEPYLQATDIHMTVFVVVAILVLPALVIGVGMLRIYKRKKA